jgi:hypothetical protein
MARQPEKILAGISASPFLPAAQDPEEKNRKACHNNCGAKADFLSGEEKGLWERVFFGHTLRV